MYPALGAFVETLVFFRVFFFSFLFLSLGEAFCWERLHVLRRVFVIYDWSAGIAAKGNENVLPVSLHDDV